MLEEEVGSARLAAAGIPGLFQAQASNPYQRPTDTGPYQQSQSAYIPPAQQPNLSQNPYAQGPNYYRGNAAGGFEPFAQKHVNNGWIGGAIGLGILVFGFCCFVGPLASIGLTIWGMSSAKHGRDLGHPGGQAAYIFNVVVLVLACIGLAFSLFIIGLGNFLD